MALNSILSLRREGPIAFVFHQSFAGMVPYVSS